MKLKSEILDSSAFNRALVRIAHQIIEKNGNVENLAVIGIKTRGVPIAQRLAKNIYDIEGVKVDVGVLDITLYRDDLSHISPDPIINSTDINFDINGKTVVLADDVIYTGRTCLLYTSSYYNYIVAETVDFKTERIKKFFVCRHRFKKRRRKVYRDVYKRQVVFTADVNQSIDKIGF